eukprot:CAMPEP_0170368854 /NCGR_PEP_ID=MMETSP0117_2-20130122/7673_1 /TAXON_ID=400756 /ORGANISM="Durinskia baltica, Strain CSIRO CS-38" /LENGTH=370 /DNA_ID=CAMNT_0010623537 /DNA_START=1 /DNA_END=1113 /DNA_ORIENTATION=+
MLFPDQNVEFTVAGAYQVVSIVTVVAALSASKSLVLAPRIYGGFGGQFACLAAIFAFRWMDQSEEVMYCVLMSLVCLCSVATGFLDSALLSLCAQYSPRMQQHLQIGIGFGTFMSVVYRDTTKLLLPGNVADATSLYFIVALLTVLVCVTCYRLLMTLPVSQHIVRSQGAGRGGASTPLLDESSSSESEKDAQQHVAAQSSFSNVWRIVRKNQLVVFLNFALTTLYYPGLLTSIPCRQFKALRAHEWFQELLLTVFTVGDILGRFATGNRFGLNYSNIWLTVVVRATMFPLIMVCIFWHSLPDIVSMAAVAVFGVMNGYCGTLSLMVVLEVPELVHDEQRKTCGRFSALGVNGGLAVAGGLVAMIFDIGA